MHDERWEHNTNISQVSKAQPPFTMITVVSGLPRSGTSMMMKMLEAGGMEVLTDKIRTPDDDNPQGYYEYDAVKTIRKDAQWVAQANGKAVKIISQLLYYLPDTWTYHIIFMKRNVEEVIASQNHMLARMGKLANPVSDAKLIALFQKHLSQIEAWLTKQAHIRVLYLEHYEVINHPLDHSYKIRNFLQHSAVLEPERMATIIDKNLYRQRMYEKNHIDRH